MFKVGEFLAMSYPACLRLPSVLLLNPTLDLLVGCHYFSPNWCRFGNEFSANVQVIGCPLALA